MKRLISYFVVFFLFISCTYAITVDEAANTLVKMKLMSGYPDGTLGLENNITRAEFCTLVAKMLGINDEQNVSNNSFSDLASTHWAYKSVMALANRGIISGYQDLTFRPSNQLTYAECSAILIGVLGYKDDLVGVWPTNITSMAKELGLNKNLYISAHSDKMTRGSVSIMLINAMEVVVKN